MEVLSHPLEMVSAVVLSAVLCNSVPRTVLFSAVLYRQAAASPAVPRFLANLAMVPLPSCGRGADATEQLLRAKEKETTVGTRP